MPCGLRFAGRETVKGFPAVVGVSLRGGRTWCGGGLCKSRIMRTEIDRLLLAFDAAAYGYGACSDGLAITSVRRTAREVRRWAGVPELDTAGR